MAGEGAPWPKTVYQLIFRTGFLPTAWALPTASFCLSTASLTAKCCIATLSESFHGTVSCRRWQARFLIRRAENPCDVVELPLSPGLPQVTGRSIYGNATGTATSEADFWLPLRYARFDFDFIFIFGFRTPSLCSLPSSLFRACSRHRLAFCLSFLAKKKKKKRPSLGRV